MKQTAQIFKALSDETRLRIIGLLVEGELCVCDLVAILNLPQSTVSRHLAYLKNSGLVSDRRQGIWMHYRLTDSESILQKDIQTLLRKNLSDISQVKNDQQKLRAFLARKQGAAC
ncbi:MAG: metalloregulator ArsR/SmtB family transcription factor [Thermoleophilia bacterium]|nr:metalloregulator ArsR/SmtB family transcription factor [Thermoleophilia bacterium]